MSELFGALSRSLTSLDSRTRVESRSLTPVTELRVCGNAMALCAEKMDIIRRHTANGIILRLPIVIVQHEVAAVEVVKVVQGGGGGERAGEKPATGERGGGRGKVSSLSHCRLISSSHGVLGVSMNSFKISSFNRPTVMCQSRQSQFITPHHTATANKGAAVYASDEYSDCSSSHVCNR